MPEAPPVSLQDLIGGVIRPRAAHLFYQTCASYSLIPLFILNSQFLF